MSRRIVGLLALCALAPIHAGAQTPTNMAVLQGLAPVTTLSKTYAGRAALAANYSVTGGIQSGAIRQPTLLPFADQQQLALRDAFITDGNLAELADGLGTTLGAAYQARAHYNDREHFTSISPAVAKLIATANATTSGDSNSGKYFFANATTDGRKPVSAEAASILERNGGATDPFGRSYFRLAGSPGADAYGNSRPFQTLPSLLPITGPDYFSAPADNVVYNRGPVMNLTDSPSYPSGHTTYGYMGSILLAVLVPERYPQMIVRASEYGNDRILLGAHYAMDVLAGRTLATYDLAHLLANDPAYTTTDFQAALKTARADVIKALESGCGNTIQICAREDIGRFSASAMNEAFYATTQTYGLPVVYPEMVGKTEDVAKLTPEAGYLLTTAFPSLSLDQANQILTETQGPGGGFLNNGSPFGLYSRLNLHAAALRAAQVTNSK